MNRHHEDWITRDELQRLTGWSERTIFRKQSSGELRTRQITGEGACATRNGKPAVEYSAASLPADLQLKRMQQRMTSQALVPVKHSPTAIATLPTPESGQVVAALSSLSPEDQAQARGRMQVLAPMIDFQNKTNGHKPLFRLGDGKEITSLSAIVKYAAAATGYSERTIWDWWKRFTRDGGASALVDRARSDNGRSRYFQEHREVAAFAQNKFLNEKRVSIRLIYEEILRAWPRLRASGEDQPPDYKTLRTYLQREVSPLVKIVAREGERAYNEKAAPFLIRNVEAKRVNEYWISDHMIHDVWVRNDGVFGELAPNEAFRPWLTCIADMKSRRVVGTAWCVNPSSNTISSALQFGLRHYGRPECFYVDNGKDFRKLARLSPEQRLRALGAVSDRIADPPPPSDDASGVLINLGVLLRLGIEPQHCLPFHPQSKQIESFFRTLHQRFDVIWGDAYCGISALDRPEECDRLLREHKKLLKEGRGEESPLPPASRFIQDAAYWIHEFNATFRHSGQGMHHRTPQQVFDAELPSQRRPVVDIKAIAPLFWDYKDRVVQEGGCVEIFNARYEPADQESSAALMLSVTTKIKVACDPLNLGEAIAFDQQGKFLGHLRAQALMIHGETREEDIRASMRARHTYYRAVKTYAATLERSRHLAGDVTVLESLERRAAASAVQPNIHALPVPKAVGERAQPRLHVDDIADSYTEDN